MPTKTEDKYAYLRRPRKRTPFDPDACRARKYYDSDLVSPQEACTLLSESRQWFYRNLAQFDEVYRISGRGLRITYGSIRRFLAARRITHPEDGGQTAAAK